MINLHATWREFLMNNKPEIVKLTSAEISAMWATYIYDSIRECIMAHFSETCTDPEILPLIEETKKLSKEHMNVVSQLFLKEKIILPEGFKVEKHVVPNAPKLFSDIFYINYVLFMCQFALASNTTALTNSAREDVRKMFKDFMEDASNLFNVVVDLMQNKGIYIRMPSMIYPNKIDYINKENFLTGWFGRRRSLLGIEVTQLINTAVQNELGRGTCVGFAQVTQDAEIREHFQRGKKLCKYIQNSIHDVLMENDVPAPTSWDNSVNDSTVAPFSDQLMLFIISTLSNFGMINYGTGFSVSMRRDVNAMYANFITKTTAYAEDGMNLMIERQWMEQPPQFEDHGKLAAETR